MDRTVTDLINKKGTSKYVVARHGPQHIPLNLIKWIQHFLSARSTQLKFNVTTSEPIPTPAGIPQGSPLSPLLYMYYNADLLDITSGKIDTMSLGFIDDIVYGVQGESNTGNIRKIKRLLEKAEEWRKKHRAQFEMTKYVLVHYTRNRRKTTKALVTLNGTTIHPSVEAKYLGITFDQQLRYRAHR